MAVNFYAEKSMFVDTGTYNPMFLRTYQTNFNTDITNKFMEATRGGANISSTSMAGISADIITPSAAPTANLNIENGWQHKRMTFMMVIGSDKPTGFGSVVRSTVLTGYTDHCDVSPLTSAFDPSMKLYFNSSSILSTVTVRHPMTGEVSYQRRITDASHLLTNNLFQSIQKVNTDSHTANTLWYATPKNVIDEMQNFNDRYNHAYNPHTVDYRSIGNPMLVERSFRSNAEAPTYLSKILRNVTDRVKQVAHGQYDDENLAYSEASGAVGELRIMADDVVSYLHFTTGLGQNGYITWGELCGVVPNLENTTRFSLRSSNVVARNTPDAVAGNFNGWQAPTKETLAATIISQDVPSIMCSCLLGSLDFMFTNDNITMEPTVCIYGGHPLIDGVSIESLTSPFITRFLTEIAPMITDNGRTIVNAMVNCNLSTETYVSVSRDGDVAVPYCAPTFCDGLYTPIISTQQNQIQNIANDLQLFVNSVSSFQ